MQPSSRSAAPRVLVASLSALLTLGVVTAPSDAATTELVSVTSNGRPVTAASSFPSISANGRFVVFGSSSRNLVDHDTNGADDVFLHDRKTQRTRRVSVSSAGRQANGRSSRSQISADGRFVLFNSSATNLVRPDANGTLRDFFVYNRKTRKTRRVSVSSAGVQGNRASSWASISADGRFVAFNSSATNLVPDDANGVADIYVRNRKAHTTRRVSISSAGEEADHASHFNSISANGRFVAFDSAAHNLVAGGMGFSGNDVFVHDRRTHRTEQVSVSSAGAPADSSSLLPSLSANGRFVAFQSRATNLVAGDTNGNSDVFVHDLERDRTRRVSVNSAGRQGNRESGFEGPPATVVSADGRFVAFESESSNLVRHDTNRTYDVFVRDRARRKTRLVSRSSNGRQSNGSSFWPSLSADARFVAFASGASNLVRRDKDVQQRRLRPGAPPLSG